MKTSSTQNNIKTGSLSSQNPKTFKGMFPFHKIFRMRFLRISLGMRLRVKMCNKSMMNQSSQNKVTQVIRDGKLKGEEEQFTNPKNLTRLKTFYLPSEVHS